MADMTQQRSLRRRSVQLLLLAAMLSLSSTNSVHTVSAFTHSTKRRQRPVSSPSSTSLYFQESTEIRSESDATSKIVQHRRHDNSKHLNNPNNEWLRSLGLPFGLRNTLLDNISEVSNKRIWIIDNSGSMKMMDGHEVLPENDGKKCEDNEKEKVLVTRSSITNGSADGDTSRWAELRETVMCHAQLLSILKAPTDFRLLNPPSNGGPQKFRVGYTNNNMLPSMPSLPGIFRRKNQSDSNQQNNNFQLPSMPSMPSIFGRNRGNLDQNRAQKFMTRNKPKGKTPLHEAVLEARKDVIRVLPRLRADGTKVTIVICTDGSSTGSEAVKNENGEAVTVEPYQELEDALESLQGLPVNVVIRLCTDYGEVVDFYNDLDERFGESSFVDVIDDYEAEAAQVYGQNPWLNYALVLHRMRELGLQGSSGLLDCLDQRPFTGDEIREFTALLFGTTADLLPDPLCDWENFVVEIDRLQQREQMHWNPAKMAVTPWIDTEELLAMQ